MFRSFVIFALLLCVLCGLGTPALPADYTGAQISIDLSAKQLLAGSNALTGDVMYFTTPSKKTDPLYLVYAGVKHSLADNADTWVQPLVGYVGGWFPYDGMILALWGGQSYWGMDFSIDTEVFAGGGQTDLFGYHAIDHKFGAFTVGLHGEHVNDILQVGPHLKYDAFKVQYFEGAGKRAIRFNITADL